MTEPRFTIRIRYEPTGNRYQIVQEGSVLSDHPTKEAAVAVIREMGARVAAVWSRTDLGSGPLHADFAAKVLDEEIGRIMRIPHGPREGEWSWSMTAHKKVDAFKMALQGSLATKQEAARMVEWAYTQCKEDRPDFIPDR